MRTFITVILRNLAYSTKLPTVFLLPWLSVLFYFVLFRLICCRLDPSGLRPFDFRPPNELLTCAKCRIRVAGCCRPGCFISFKFISLLFFFGFMCKNSFRFWTFKIYSSLNEVLFLPHIRSYFILFSIYILFCEFISAFSYTLLFVLLFVPYCFFISNLRFACAHLIN